MELNGCYRMNVNYKAFVIPNIAFEEELRSLLDNINLNYTKCNNSYNYQLLHELWILLSLRVHHFIGGGAYSTLYTAAKHTALSYDAIRY